MIKDIEHPVDPLQGSRMLVVGDGPDQGGLAAELRARYPDWTVATCDTFLSSIHDLSHRGARVVLAWVDPTLAQLSHALTGLREAAGPATRLVLCCTPEYEPIARTVLRCGVDDYVLYPLEGDELDAAIGYARLDGSTEPAPAEAPVASMEEIVQFGAILRRLGGRPAMILERLASLIRLALKARGAMIVVEGAVASAGTAPTNPVLTAPLKRNGRVIGQLSLDERAEGAYTPAEVRKLTHYATVASGILEAALQQREWRRLAVTDECSGLPNRRYFNTRLDEILARAAAEHFHVTVLLFDVDDFKAYNDLSGHDVGDEIIRIIGELLRQHSREQDIVARYGGDEFAVVFWDPEGPRMAGSREPDSALAVLERFKEALRTHQFPLLGPSGRGRLTISGGVATYPWDGTTRAELLKRADEALLAAKRAGKNRIFLIGDAKASASSPS